MPESVTGLKIEEMEKLVVSLGEPPYRSKQLLGWIYQKLAASFDDMTDLPLEFRQKLAGKTSLTSLTLINEVRSRDGTVKALFQLADGNTVESALMLYAAGEGRPRTTICVSTQAGCAIGCPFCATGQQGFIRNLSAGEIIDQALFFARKLKAESKGKEERLSRITNVVFMGMGEPLANYDTVMQAIGVLNSPLSFGLGARNITISTVGMVAQIKKLSEEKLQVGLAVSLHAANEALRNRLVPLNQKYPLKNLIPVCREYVAKTGRRISFEYILFKGVNDSPEQAQELADLLKGLNCHVNLIPANKTGDAKYQPPYREVILAFETALNEAGITCTLRQSRGQDIDAGCGQLRSRFLQN